MMWRKSFTFSILFILVFGTIAGVSYGYGNDMDGDGYPDSDDVVPAADAGIKISIEYIRLKDAVDTWPADRDVGQIFAKFYINDTLVGTFPSEPVEMAIDEPHEVDWAITQDVADNTPIYTIRIELYDRDNSSDELIDINGANAAQDEGGYYLEVEYYLGDEIGRKQSGITDGSDDGNSGLEDDKDAQIEYTLETVKINHPPSVSLATPVTGSVVNGSVVVSGSASDVDDGIQSVDVKIDDGSWRRASGTTSWTYDWDTTQVNDGSHIIYARSYDTYNYSTEQSVMVTVDNTADKPPMVNISSPSDGDTVTSYATVSGSASFSKGTMGGVQVKIDDGVWKTAAGTTSWTFDWNTIQVSDGNHTIHARSYDGEDYSDIDSITLTVDNKEDDGGDTAGFQFVLLLAAAFIALLVLRRKRVT